MNRVIMALCAAAAAMACAACGSTGGAGRGGAAALTPATVSAAVSAGATAPSPVWTDGAASATPGPTHADGAEDDAARELFMPGDDLTLGAPRILIQKRERLLTLLDGDTPVARVRIGLGFEPEGDKEREGDGRTPVGEYYVCTRNAQSRFYLSLGLSYPSVKDAERGYAAGLIDKATRDTILERIGEGKRPPWDTALGGEIMIHGYGGGSDWTAGCVAVDDDVMDMLFTTCGIGTPVTIEE